MKKNDFLSWFISASFFLLLVLFSIVNFCTISKPVKKFIHSDTNIRSLSEDITYSLKSDELFLKDELININGLYGKISGRRLYNEVVLLNNGMLTAVQEYMKDIGESTEALIDFQKFARKRGARFLYVQFPFKIDMDGTLAPQGLDFKGPNYIESTLETFRNVGIDVIDTIPALSRTPADVTENFYRTDHHWKPTAAFKAFQIIIQRISELYPEEIFSQDILDFTKWTVHEIPEHFLGSRGKRVGKYFAGLDSLQWLTPDFTTDLSMSVPERHQFIKGNYEEVFIRTEYLEKGLNLLHTNHYCVYIGKDYPMMQIRNPKAPSSLKLLLIKDSYALPLITFFSMIFREVDIIDPRYHNEPSIQEYVDRTSPDIILLATYSAMGMNSSYFYKFKKSQDLYLDDSELLLKKEEIIIDRSENSNNSVAFYEGFENEQCYTLFIPEIKLTDGETDAVSVALYDDETQKFVTETVFDCRYCNESGNCKWTFETPKSGSNALRLLLYSGIRDQTENTGVIYTDVGLFRNGLKK